MTKVFTKEINGETYYVGNFYSRRILSCLDVSCHTSVQEIPNRCKSCLIHHTSPYFNEMAEEERKQIQKEIEIYYLLHG